LITRAAAGLRLSRREEAWKTAEILMLRHQLAVLQRRQPRRPKLNWGDRALLATLLGVIPKARRQGLRLLVTPDTIVRWHRDIVRRHWAARSMRGERLVGTLRRELPDRILILNQSHLRALLTDYQEHYNTAPATSGHRPARPQPCARSPRHGSKPATCQIRRKPVLSGLINEYERAA
jgi:hypothetical protein